MGTGLSGLFNNTTGEIIYKLKEDIQKIIYSNGEISYLLQKLPGQNGMYIENRLSDQVMSKLTEEYNIEFAQVYVRGPGKNGRSGKYYLYSGDINSILVPVNKDTILINHTHPNGTPYPSKQDMKLMMLYKQMGSPQNSSSIIPIGKKTIRFTFKGVKE